MAKPTYTTDDYRRVFPNFDSMPNGLSVKATAAALGVSEPFLNNDRVNRQRVPFVRIGAKIAYLKTDLAEYVLAGRVGGGK